VTQQRLRRHDDQRLALHADGLTAQHMEDLSSRGRHAHFHVHLGTQLHEALRTSGRVLRTLTFIAVRQKHDQTAGTAPFRLTGRDELVDNNLCTVGEVTELAFPNDELIRIGRGITVIKSEDASSDRTES